MVTLQVTGMSCNHCVEAVKKAVGAIDSNATVDIDLETGQVDITSSNVDKAFVQAIEDAGYEVAG